MKRNKALKMALVLFIVAILISMTLYIYLRPEAGPDEYSMKDILDVWEPYSLDEVWTGDFRPGDEIVLKDRLAGKELYNSTYGPITRLCFEPGMWSLILIGDRYDEFDVGSQVSVPLTFKTMHYNGIEAMFIEELYLPLFIMHEELLRGVSEYRGIPIEKESRSTKEVHITNVGTIERSFELSLMDVALNRGSEFYGGEMTGRMEPLLDHMDHLRHGTSEGRYLTFEDEDGDGNLSTGDIITVEGIEPTSDRQTLDTYIVSVEGMLGAQYVITSWYDGIFDVTLDPIRSELPGAVAPWMSGYAHTFLENTDTKAVIRVDSLDEEHDLLREVGLMREGEEVGNATWAHKEFFFQSLDGATTVSYEDANSNGELDVGDIFYIDGTEKGNRYILSYRTAEGTGLHGIDWTAGMPPSHGNYPLITFSETPHIDADNGTYNISVDSIIGRSYVPCIDLQLILFMGDEELYRDFACGTIMVEDERPQAVLRDLDGDGWLSRGDSLIVGGSLDTGAYKLEVYHIGSDEDEMCGSFSWIVS